MITHVSILVKFISGDEVNWENNLDVVLFCLLNEGSNLLGTSLVEEGVADLTTKISKTPIKADGNPSYRDVLKDLLEGESHSSANNKRVDL